MSPTIKTTSLTNSGNLETLQFLRFVAAGSVLLAHVSFYIHHRASPDMPIMGQLAQGVALFFVISGFIMTITAVPKVGTDGYVRYFILSRLIRIVPIYWIMNTAKLLGLLLLPGLIQANPTVSNVVFSYLFLRARNAEGIEEAFYGVGWSLNFEMAFYAFIALALFLKLRPTVLLIPVLLLGAALSQVKTDDYPAITDLFRPALLTFVWGILIGEWYLAGHRLNGLVASALIVLGVALIFVPNDALGTGWAGNLHASLSFGGLPFGYVILGFVGVEDRIGNRIPHLFRFFGDASYSLYLTHPMFGVFVVVVLHKFAPWLHIWGLFVLAVGLSLTFAAAFYVYIEKPITHALRAVALKRQN